MRRAVSLKMSRDGIWWECGGRARRITGRQADRVLAAIAELFVKRFQE